MSVDLIGRILDLAKREIGEYQAAAAYLQDHPSVDPAREAVPGMPGRSCRTGDINLEITQARIELNVTTTTATTGGLGLTIPVTGPTGTVGPAVSGSHAASNTQALALTFFPAPDYRPAPALAPNRPGSIASILLGLRAGMIQASMREPCFTTDAPETLRGSAPANTVSIGFKVVSETGGSLTLALAVLNANLGQTRNSSNSHTLTVTFRAASGTGFFR